MKYYLVCPVATVSGTQDLLTYESSFKYVVGEVVEIPVGKKTKVGVIFDEVKKPKFSTKEILKSYKNTLPIHLIQLAEWIGQYYATRLPFVMQSMLPSGISKKRRDTSKKIDRILRQSKLPKLTPQQLKIYDDINKSRKTTHLLHGVTGSGKTRIYQELAKKTLQDGLSVMILVPEIALTPQLSAEFEKLHKSVIVMHSRLTEAERHKNWLNVLSLDSPCILVGPRSTLFSPINNLGLIVIDEAHEPSYQQTSQPKYNALRVARRLADLTNNQTKLVLGSATPLVTDYYYAAETKTPIHKLNQKTVTQKTEVELVDITDRSNFSAHTLFSNKLLKQMNKSVDQNEQILLFHNRRGTARMSLCTNCGWTAKCSICHIPLRLHQDKNQLICHICGFKQSPPKACPDCNSVNINFVGFGSKRIELEVKKLYPNLNVARFDSDTEIELQIQNRYQDLYDNKINIIIGTQGVVKGLDLPHLTTVGVIQADSELFIPDYSSTERSFQLISQVVGRVGRKGQESKVIIQTLNPNHPAIKYGAAQDYDRFYKFEIAERKFEHMPPFVFILQLIVGYSSVERARSEASKIAKGIKTKYPKISIRGPAPAFHEHYGSKYYQQLLIASSSRNKLVDIARDVPPRWRYTLDPINLL